MGPEPTVERNKSQHEVHSIYETAIGACTSGGAAGSPQLQNGLRKLVFATACLCFPSQKHLHTIVHLPLHKGRLPGTADSL